MDENLDRRRFAKRASLAVGGLMAIACFGSDPANAQDPDNDDNLLTFKITQLPINGTLMPLIKTGVPVLACRG